MGIAHYLGNAARNLDNAAGHAILAVGMPIRNAVFRAISWNGGAYSSESGMPFSENARSRSDAQWLSALGEVSALAKPIDRIAEDTSVVPWHLWRILPGIEANQVGPRRQEVHEHGILDLWKRPNPLMTGRAFRDLLTRYILSVGRSPVRIERWPGKNTPRHLWPLVPTDVKKMPDVGRHYWVIQENGKRKRVPLEDIIWITRPDPKDPLGWGLGKAAAVADEVAQIEWMNRYNSAFFREGAHLGKVINIPGMDDDTALRIQSDFKTKHVGIMNAFRTLFTGSQGTGQMTVTDLSPAHKELDFNAGAKRLDDAIRQQFGVPPECVGDVTNSNRSTIDAADYLQQKKNVLPQLISMAEWVNLFVVPLYPDAQNLLLLHENPVEEGTEMRHQMLNDGLRAGSVMVDEWREGHDMDPLPDGDGQQRLVPVNITMVLPDGKVETPTAQATPTTSPDSAKVLPSNGKVLALIGGAR